MKKSSQRAANCLSSRMDGFFLMGLIVSSRSLVLVQLKLGKVALHVDPLCPRLVFLEKQKPLHDQSIHVSGHKAGMCILRRAHDGFTSDVEAGVDQDGTASLFLETSKQFMVRPVPFPIDGLKSHRIVDVGHRWHLRAAHPKPIQSFVGAIFLTEIPFLGRLYGGDQ